MSRLVHHNVATSQDRSPQSSDRPRIERSGHQSGCGGAPLTHCADRKIARRLAPLATVAVTLGSVMLFGYDTLADELDSWCAQARKASSIVICSDAELRQQAVVRNTLLDIAKGMLGPYGMAKYSSIVKGQSLWVKSYTAACGVAIDGPLPPIPVPSTIIECFKNESRKRSEALRQEIIKVTGIEYPTSPNHVSIPSPVPEQTEPDPRPQNNSAFEGAKQAVRNCVASVRRQARNPDAFEFGSPPLWSNFDAYLSPDGLVHNNAYRNGDLGGKYRFNKCLAEMGYSLRDPH